MTASNSYKMFLPVGSHVALREPGGVARWYDTKKEVDLPEEVTVVPCPLRTRVNKDGIVIKRVMVNHVTHFGIEIYFLPEQMRTRLDPDAIAFVARLGLTKMEYDIPTGADVKHPSTYMWARGVRTTKSCWCVPAGNVPHTRINELLEAGATCDVVKYDAGEAAKLLDQAIRALVKEIKGVETRSAASVETGITELAALPETVTPEEVAAAEKKCLATAKALQKRQRKLLGEMSVGASIFGIDTNRLRFENAANTVDSLAVSMAERAKVWVAATNAARVTGTSTGVALAAAAAADALPPEVLADYLRENGQEVQADAVEAAFAVAPPPAEEPEVAPAEDGSFSLLDTIDSETPAS